MLSNVQLSVSVCVCVAVKSGTIGGQPFAPELQQWLWGRVHMKSPASEIYSEDNISLNLAQALCAEHIYTCYGALSILLQESKNKVHVQSDKQN